MPTRTQQDVSGTDGIKLLHQYIPSEWTVIDLPEQVDYGIDAEVEIFLLRPDGHASATAWTFRVQSRATAGTAKTVYLTQSQYNYMSRFDVPVLIAQPHIVTGELYYGWLHSRRAEPTDSGKSLRFELSESDRWVPTTPDDLVSSLKAYRAIRARTAFLPLTIRVAVAGESEDSEETMRLADALSSALTKLTHLVIVEVGENTPETAGITVSSDGTRIALGEVASVTVPPPSIASAKGYSHFAADALYCLAESLVAIGYAALGLKVATAVVARTVHTRDLRDGGGILATPATDPLLLDDAILFWEAAAAASHPVEPILFCNLLITSLRLPSGEIAKLRGFARRRATINGLVPALELIRSTSEQLLQDGSFGAASAVWRIGSDLLPETAESYSALRSRAGAEFLASEFASSAEHYELALTVAPEDKIAETKALLGDVYIKLGRIRQARDLFALRTDNPEWHLKCIVTSYLIDDLGLPGLADVSDSKHAESIEYANVATASGVVRLTKEEAFRCGADPVLWFNAANRLTELQALHLGAEFSTVAAVLGDPHDPESLALAIVRWISVGVDPDKEHVAGSMFTMGLLVEVAAQKYGSAILEQYEKLDIPAHLIELVSHMIDECLRPQDRGY